MISNDPCPIIIVTGANTGVGFGICHRLLFHLSSGRRDTVSNDLELGCDGLTLILACRSKQRAEAAQAKLYGIADELVRTAKHSPDYDGHAEIFRKNLQIAIHNIDLASIESVFHFSDEIAQTYPYVSHLICNAGLACFERIVWPLAIYQCLTDFIAAVTSPAFFLQRVGDVSQDGLGWVWQCNVFGHYALFRVLEPMLAKYRAAGPRVVWISSHEASPKFYDPKDWQLVKSEHSYQCSKYQMNMIALYLDREATRGQLDGTPVARHLIAYPGVAGTSIATALLGTFRSFCMYAAFYIARFLGSTNHPICIFKAAISAVHLALVGIACLPSVSGAASPTNTMDFQLGTIYISKTDRWGREYVGTTTLNQSQEEKVQTTEMLEKCDRLLKTFCDVQGRASPSDYSK